MSGLDNRPQNDGFVTAMFMFFLSLQDDVAHDFFWDLYLKYKEPMWRYARTITGDEFAADDVVHSAFASLIPQQALLQSLKPDMLDGYITVAVKNHARKYVSYKSRYAVGFENLDFSQIADDTMPSPAEWAEQGDEHRDVHAALSNLTAIEQDILSLKYAGDQDYDDIASVLGINANNARQIAYRARQKVKAMLSGGDTGD